MFRTIMKGIFSGLFHILYRFEIEGMENIPQEGNAIICPNHIHMFDSISLVIKIKRMMYIMVKKELMSNWFGKWFFGHLGCFPVDRGTGDMKALETAEQHLKDGELLLLFPEGTRNSLPKGKKLKKGASIIAAQTHSPIIPIGMVGSFRPFSKVIIRIGKPMDLSEYYQKEELVAKDYIEMTNRLQEEIVRLRDKGMIADK